MSVHCVAVLSARCVCCVLSVVVVGVGCWLGLVPGVYLVCVTWLACDGVCVGVFDMVFVSIVFGVPRGGSDGC